MLIPKPKEINIKTGCFKLTGDTRLVLHATCDYSDFESAVLLQEEIYKCIGIRLAITKAFSRDDKNSIRFVKSSRSGQIYQLEVNTDNIVVNGEGGDGLFYGVQTLRQLIRLNGSEIPCLYISDSPSLPFRGFYHDITRGKVPTLDTLKELADRASFYKVNQLQLYIEHTFAFKDQSEVWTMTDPITAEEILILDEYCRKRHIELVPSLSTFGHLYHLLLSNSYKHLNELNVSGNEPYSWLDRQLHHTLDVSDPGSFTLVEEMLNEFIPLFTSDKFNICCDETFDLGEGKNKGQAEKVGKGWLYVDFVNKIMEHVKKYNKKVMFWGDIILHHPEYLSDIPADVTCLNWDYNADVSEEGVRKIAESGLQQYVCPGVQGWNKLMNDMDTAFENISKMAQYGKKYSAAGLLNTDWGDFGHINLFSNSIPGMIFGAGVSWNPDSEPDFSSAAEKISKIEFGDTTGRLMGLLRELSQKKIIDWLHVALWYYYKTGKNVGPYGFDSFVENEFPKLNDNKIMDSYNRIVQIGDEILKLTAGVYDERKQDMEEYYLSARGLALFQALLLVIKKYEFKQQDTKLVCASKELAVRLEYWIKEYCRLWRARSKESELFRIRDIFSGVCDLLRKFD